MKESLRDFLPEYINYLAYKIERERKLLDTYDKLEGLIWQDIQMKLFDITEIDYSSNLDEINKTLQELDNAIKKNPKNSDLYFSKSKVLVDKGDYRKALSILDRMLLDFPKEEKNIQIKRAYIYKEMRDLNEGLEIIDTLIDKYQEDNDILSYKAFWLQYLNQEKESLTVIKNLIEIEPKNATYHDNYGEILMFFKKYEKAVEELSKSIELSDIDWYVYQSYIKLGFCYRELENYDLATEFFQKGLKAAKKSTDDQETKKKWIVFANLWLSEIEELESEF